MRFRTSDFGFRPPSLAGLARELRRDAAPERLRRVGGRILKAAAIAGFAAIGMATVGAQQKPADANDPRIGLKPGLRDAGVAARGMELVSTRPRPEGFYDPANPGGVAMPGERPGNATPPPPPPTAPQTGGTPQTGAGPQPYAPSSAAPPGAGALDFANSDLAFSGTHMVMGKWGYTGSACIPMALHDAVVSGRLKTGDLVVLVGSGVGHNQAGIALRITDDLVRKAG